MAYIIDLLNKVTNLIPAAMGSVDPILKAAREAVIAILRLADLVLALVGKGDILDPIIEGAVTFFNSLEKGWDTAKGFFLGIGT